MNKNNNQIKWGAIFSYILIILNATYGLFLTPYILGQIGEASYGVYKTVSAFTSSMMVLDLGLGGTMTRYIARYRADKEEEKIPNFISMGFIQTAVIGVIVIVVTSVLYNFLDVIYQNGLTASELVKARHLYIFLSLGVLSHIFENVLNGIIAGYNRFIFANGIKVARLIVRIVAVVILLGIFNDSLTLVIIDLGVTVAFVLAELLFLHRHIRLKVKFSYWDKQVFLESFKYTLFMFLTSIVAQVNTNFSSVAIGAIINSTAVTVYSIALLIFGMYEQMSTAISGVMLPTVTNTLKKDNEKYTNTISLVAQVGRIQFIILGAVFAGFIVLGRQFIQLWLGQGYEDVYKLTLILITPALFELCINVCLSILRAKNMIGFRTVVITLFTIINMAITILFTRQISYYASAIGTAFSFLVGSVIVMSIYYYKKLGINIFKIYSNIFSGVWIAITVSAVASFIVTLLVQSIRLQFILGALTFVSVYAISLFLFGLKKDEKNIILKR